MPEPALRDARRKAGETSSVQRALGRSPVSVPEATPVEGALQRVPDPEPAPRWTLPCVVANSRNMESQENVDCESTPTEPVESMKIG